MGLCELQIPAPKVETGSDFTRTKFYWYKNFNDWTREERIRTCYLYTCYCYINDIEVSNKELRKRLGVEEKNKAMVSRVIKAAVDEGYIKLADENAVVKMRRYIPYWA